MVVIPAGKDDKVEEFTQGGNRVVKVTPPGGRPYYLYDTSGYGDWVRRESLDRRRARADVADLHLRLTCRSIPPSRSTIWRPGCANYSVGALERARADQAGHREHQLLRHHHAGPLRADVVRALARGGAAVLPRPDGAPRAPRHSLPGADRRPLRRVPRHAQRQARGTGDAACPVARSRRRARPSARELGALLARLHLAGRSYPAYLENPRGPHWWRAAARDVQPFLDAAADGACSRTNCEFQAQHRFPDLPRGPVHADLFRDNALFERGRLSGRDRLLFRGRGLPAVRRRGMRQRLVPGGPGGGPQSDPARTSALLGRLSRAAALRAARSARPGRCCCAPRRCASGFRACTTCTCRARANSCTRTIRSTSAWCSSGASRKARRALEAA